PVHPYQFRAPPVLLTFPTRHSSDLIHSVAICSRSAGFSEPQQAKLQRIGPLVTSKLDATISTVMCKLSSRVAKQHNPSVPKYELHRKRKNRYSIHDQSSDGVF